MSAPVALRGCAKSAAPKTGTAKANATTALGSQSAATKTSSTKATASETTTETSSVETTATTEATTPTTAPAGPCRLSKRNKSGDYQAE